MSSETCPYSGSVEKENAGPRGSDVMRERTPSDAPVARAELEHEVQRLRDRLREKNKIIRELRQRLDEPAAEPVAHDSFLDDAASGHFKIPTPQGELREALAELKQTQAKLLQAQKLEAIGQLAAGIAHEINTPAQYVSNNTAFLQRAFENLMRALAATTAVVEAVRHDEFDPALVTAAHDALVRAKIGYLEKHVPRAIAQSIDGMTRISTIVQAMKQFSHPSGAEKQPVNIHEAIETTVTIARNEWKYVADVQLDFDETLPPVPLHRNEFNQVILNLVVNAAHAISDATSEGLNGKGRILIRTRADGTYVKVQVSDTGPGIPEKFRARVFDPFFTTKPVGKGTGQGLAIAYSVVVDKHQGTIGFETEEGAGTTFTVRLPLSFDLAGGVSS